MRYAAGDEDGSAQTKLITTNPCTPEAVSLPSKKAARASAPAQLYLTADEVNQLAEAIDPHWRLPVLIAAYCGPRAGELWALRRSDVDLLHGELHVAYALKDVWGDLIIGPTKTHSRRKSSIPKPLRPDWRKRSRHRHASCGVCAGWSARLPVHHAGRRGTRAGLDRQQRGAGAVAVHDAERHPVRHLNFLRRVWRPTINELWPVGDQLHGLRWHDLRHTCASLTVAVTPNLLVVKARLGHDDIKTTMNRYAHLLPSVDAEVADGLGALFAAASRSRRGPTSSRVGILILPPSPAIASLLCGRMR